MNTLDELAHLVKTCTDCPLHRDRTNAVPGEGPADADLMSIGEGPGFQEDKQGRPFVGTAGEFLEELLAAIGTSHQQVFIANMIKCRPPQNRDPSPAKMSSCSKYLDRQIELVNPKLIVTLGRFALGRFFPGESISRVRGKVREKDGRFIYPVMHPAAALHRQELRSIIVEDFKAIPAVLLELSQAVPADLEGRRQEGPDSEQLTLADWSGPPQTAPARAQVEQPEAPAPEQLTLF